MLATNIIDSHLSTKHQDTQIMGGLMFSVDRDQGDM